MCWNHQGTMMVYVHIYSLYIFGGNLHLSALWIHAFLDLLPLWPFGFQRILDLFYEGLDKCWADVTSSFFGSGPTGDISDTFPGICWRWPWQIFVLGWINTKVVLGKSLQCQISCPPWRTRIYTFSNEPHTTPPKEMTMLIHKRIKIFSSKWMEIDPRYIGIKYAEMFKCAFWCALSEQQTHAH